MVPKEVRFIRSRVPEIIWDVTVHRRTQPVTAVGK